MHADLDPPGFFTSREASTNHISVTTDGRSDGVNINVTTISATAQSWRLQSPLASIRRSVEDKSGNNRQQEGCRAAFSASAREFQSNGRWENSVDVTRKPGSKRSKDAVHRSQSEGDEPKGQFQLEQFSARSERDKDGEEKEDKEEHIGVKIAMAWQR